MYTQTFGSSFVSKAQGFGPGVWFNAFVEAKGMVCDFLFFVGLK
jgi:hypothetical protein